MNPPSRPYPEVEARRYPARMERLPHLVGYLPVWAEVPAS